MKTKKSKKTNSKIHYLVPVIFIAMTFSRSWAQSGSSTIISPNPCDHQEIFDEQETKTFPILANTKIWTYEEFKNTPDTFFDELGPKYSQADKLAFAKDLYKLKKQKDSIDMNDKNFRYEVYKMVIRHFQKNISEDVIKLQHEIDLKMQEFVKIAKNADPEMPDKDIYRAKTNAWPLFNLQALLGKEIKNNKTILGFSMLYPLTDDILDDPKFDKKEKKDFIIRFANLIAHGEGQAALPKNAKEEKIWKFFNLIEEEIDRKKFPGPFKAMSDLHQAQVESSVQQPDANQPVPSEEVIFNITMKKGAGSILSDAFLVEGNLDAKQAEFAANFGSITQFINDIRTVEQDLAEGQYTPYNLEFKKGVKLDALMNKVFRYVHKTFSDYEKNVLHESPLSKELSKQMAFYLNLKFLEEIARNQHLFSKKFLNKIENYLPLSLDNFKTLISKDEKK